MRKLLALLFITPLSIAACAPEDVGVVTPEEPGDTNPDTPGDTNPDTPGTPDDTTPEEEPEEEFVPEEPSEPEAIVEPDDHSGLIAFENFNYELTDALPSYLMEGDQISSMFNPDDGASWTSVDGVTAPFINETYDEVSTLDLYQSMINTVNKSLFASKHLINSAVNNIPVVGNALEIKSKYLLNNPYGESGGLGYQSTIKLSTPAHTSINLELQTFYNIDAANNETCSYSRIEGDARIFVFDLGSISSLISSCYSTTTGVWNSSSIVNNARLGTGFFGADVYNSFTEINNTNEGIDLATWRKTPLTEYKRMIKVQNGQSYEYSSKEGWWGAPKEIFTATDDKGNLIFDTEVKGDEYHSKWFMSALDGWSLAEYDSNWTWDEFRITYPDSTIHQWDSGDWGDDGMNYFMNGKDEIEQSKIVGDEFEFTDILYPYIESTHDKGGTGAFVLPADFQGSSKWAASIESLNEEAKLDYENYTFMDQNILSGNTGIKSLVTSVLGKIAAI